MNRCVARLLLSLSSVVAGGAVLAADSPTPREGDVVLRDFTFASGEVLPELRVHFRVLGRPQKDAAGRVTNAVLIMHGTTGSGAQFLKPEFADALFGPGQALDAAKYFIISIFAKVRA